MKPIIRYAGGKSVLLPEIQKHLPASFGAYFEPFMGGGAVFFHLGSLSPSHLNDQSLELIMMYEEVRDRVEDVISELDDYAARWMLDGSAAYYKVRDLTRTIGFSAARFIFLNKTSYNGLWRKNKSGQYNVPCGDYRPNKSICDPQALRAASLRLQGACLYSDDFEAFLEKNSPHYGDLVYLDPPYVPVKPDSFVDYTAEGFTAGDHERLAVLVHQMVSGGVHVIVSNSDTPWVRERYKALDIHQVQAPRNINSKGNGRGRVPELLIVGGAR